MLPPAKIRTPYDVSELPEIDVTKLTRSFACEPVGSLPGFFAAAKALQQPILTGIEPALRMVAVQQPRRRFAARQVVRRSAGTQAFSIFWAAIGQSGQLLHATATAGWNIRISAMLLAPEIFLLTFHAVRCSFQAPLPLSFAKLRWAFNLQH
mmetsp:Transcript_59534/g.98710  ORF Transcript_59534/g.98710 Transcript_59534/m.98710 type:complete len:152 (-) Transcript_59534:539-994(-)